MKADKTYELLNHFINHTDTELSFDDEDVQKVIDELRQLEEMASKQDPMWVGKKWNGNDYDAFCPKCGNGVWEMNYCNECGQKLDWSDND